MDDATGIVITPPKGFVPPEGTSGKPFDMVCTFEATPDGKLKMTKLGDSAVGETSDSKPDYSKYAQGLMGAMEPGESEESEMD